MSQRLLLQEITRVESNERAKNSLLIWPVGALEQHGPHLPVGTDDFQVEALTRAAAKLAAEKIPALVAPTLPFGSSQHHVPFGGTMSIGTETYYRLLVDLLESLIKGGYRRFFIVNGHGGNHELAQLAARDLALKHSVSIAAASFWTVAWDALVALDAHKPGRLPGHAGFFETSLMLHLHGDLIDKSKLPHRDNVASTDPRGWMRTYRAEHAGAWQKIDGYSDSPDRADAALGEKYFNAVVETLSAAMIEFYQQCPS